MGGGYEEQTESVCTVLRQAGRIVAAPGVIYARARLNLPSVAELPKEIEGRGAFFHPGCPPDAIGWVRRVRSSD